MAISKKFYSKQGLWNLFLVCALPIHLWAFFLGLRDLDWITARTNFWDAIGVLSYGLIFAFIESLAVFLAAAVLGSLVSGKWDEKKRITLMGTLFIILPFWSMINQAYFLRGASPSSLVVEFFTGISRPLVALYAVMLFLVGLSFLLPTFFILRSNKIEQALQNGFERPSTLMGLYLFFDVIALIIIIVRNL